MHFLADAVSALRFVLAFVVSWAMLAEQPALAFWLWCLAWSTDLVDGRIARHYGSWSKNKKVDADGIADSALGFLPTAVLIFTIDPYMRIFTGVMWVLSVVSAIYMIATMKRWAVALNMIVFHGLYQIWFVGQVLGQQADLGLWTAMLSAILGSIAALHLPKMELWWKGKLA